MFQNSFELEKKFSTESSTKNDKFIRSKSSDIVGASMGMGQKYRLNKYKRESNITPQSSKL